jgi:hypothetical protein
MKEHRLRMYQNRALWKIIGPKREAAAGSLRKPHKERIIIICILHRILLG